MSECVVVVWRLVPYHDARFSVAARRVDLSVIEMFGQDENLLWSNDVSRAFAHTSLAKDKNDDSPAGPFRRLKEQLDKLAPKIVAIQGWADPAAIMTARWALKNNARIVIFSESNRYDHRRLGWSEWLKRRILGVCDAALVGGSDHIDYLADLGFDKGRIALGYNVVDNAHFAPPTPKAGSNEAPSRVPYFLVVSRLVENKNIERVIKAYSAYRSRSKASPWDLVILGTGPLEDQLRGLIAELRNEDHVRLEGFRKYHELPDVYHNAGALVHASTSEPWGLVVNEAMAAGLPIIVSSRCGCCCELVENGVNGFTFEPENTETLIQHMCELAEGSVDIDAYRRNSLRIIDDWGPDRFAAGFGEAVEIAQRSTSGKRVLDRLIVGAISQWNRLLSQGTFLNMWAASQN